MRANGRLRMLAYISVACLFLMRNATAYAIGGASEWRRRDASLACQRGEQLVCRRGVSSQSVMGWPLAIQVR